MPDLSRRTIVHVAGGFVLGVGAFGWRLRWPGFYGGELRVVPALDDRMTLEHLTVDLDDERIADVDPIQEAIERTDKEIVRTSLSRSEYRTVEPAFEELPYYDPIEDDDYHGSHDGCPVADDENTYLVSLTPYCGRLVDARNEGLSRLRDGYIE